MPTILANGHIQSELTHRPQSQNPVSFPSPGIPQATLASKEIESITCRYLVFAQEHCHATLFARGLSHR